MNKELLKTIVFSKEVELVESKQCPFCKKPINLDEFHDRASRAEYAISGLCQECQDRVFGV